ncbi:hypothetical protein ACHWQZ_G009326 [Mnemiopsis leidyi]
MPSTPHISLNHITQITDVIFYLQGEAAKGSERLRAYGSLSLERPPLQRGTIKAHATINDDFMKDFDIPLILSEASPSPLSTSNQNFTTTTQGDYPDIYKNQLQQSIDNTPSDTITCYTDGSKTDEVCGAGYIITTDNNNTIIHEESHRGWFG